MVADGMAVGEIHDSLLCLADDLTCAALVVFEDTSVRMGDLPLGG